MPHLPIVEDFTQGDEFKIKISHIPAEDVTGGVFIFTMKSKETDTSAALEISHTAGDDAADDVLNGIVYITIPAVSTDLLDPGKYLASVVKKLGGYTTTLLRTGIHGASPVRVFKKLTS